MGLISRVSSRTYRSPSLECSIHCNMENTISDLTLPSLNSTLPNDTIDNFHDASDQINEIIASYEKQQLQNETENLTNISTTTSEEIIVNDEFSSTSSEEPEINQ